METMFNISLFFCFTWWSPPTAPLPQLVEALRYKPEGLGFYSRWCLTFMGPCVLNVFLSTTNKMQRYIIFFIIVKAVHVLSGLSAQHQELKSVHSASGICQTCLMLQLAWMLAVAANKFDKYPMLHVQI
jgi:hypothetical protein